MSRESSTKMSAILNPTEAKAKHSEGVDGQETAQLGQSWASHNSSKYSMYIGQLIDF